MAQTVNAPNVVGTDNFPVTQVYDSTSGTLVPVSAGTTSTDTSHGSQISAPLKAQLSAGSALAGGVYVVDSAGTNKAGVDSTHNLYITNGGTTATAVAAAAAAAAIKATPGRLCKVLVTTLGTAALNFYDNASAASGTIIGAIPASAAVGTIYDFQMPAAAGIYCNSGTNTPAVTVSFC